MARVLVAGGAGFIGSHVVDALIDAGDLVHVLDNLSTGRLENVAHLVGHRRFSFTEHDITAAIGAGKPFDVILNFACPASPVDFDRLGLEIMSACSQGVARLLTLAYVDRAKFLHASTSEVYGDAEINPQPEAYAGHVNTTGPRAVYDEGKRFAEALVLAHHRRHGTDVRIARIFNTYGPRMRTDDGRVVPAFVTAALTGQPLDLYDGGTRTRSLCYVADLVDGLLRLLASGITAPVNLGSDEERTVHEIGRMVAELVPDSTSVVREVPLPDVRSGDPWRRCPDLSRARRSLGWSATTSLHDGLAATVADFRKRVAR